MSYTIILNAIKSTLGQHFKLGQENALLNDVKIMAGGFNGIEDILNMALHAPAVGIGIRGFATSTRNYASQLESIADFSLYLITSDNNKAEIGDGVLEGYELLEALKLIIKDGKWGLDNVWQTEDNSIVCNNYYAPEFYKNKITLWEISWRQKILLGKNKWQAEEIIIKDANANTKIKNSEKVETISLNIKGEK